jgi:hypothetical protein
MKLFFLLFLSTILATAQTKKIDFFGTEFLVNNSCAYKPSEGANSLKYAKNSIIWSDAPPKLMRSMMISMMKKAIKGKKAKEIKSEELKVSLLKESWSGKFDQYQQKGNDSIINFISLYGEYNKIERLLIIAYKTPKQEPFRIPTYFDFLIK